MSAAKTKITLPERPVRAKNASQSSRVKTNKLMEAEENVNDTSRDWL